MFEDIVTGKMVKQDSAIWLICAVTNPTVPIRP